MMQKTLILGGVEQSGDVEKARQTLSSLHGVFSANTISDREIRIVKGDVLSDHDLLDSISDIGLQVISIY